jgi:lipoprotein-anchoring transpeptidase ErfK/SrfK
MYEDGSAPGRAKKIYQTVEVYVCTRGASERGVRLGVTQRIKSKEFSMRRILVSARLATGLCIAAGAGLVLIVPRAQAAGQPVDPGWQLAYPDQNSYGGGLFEGMFGDSQPVARAYQAPPQSNQAPRQYYQPAPAPQQPRVYRPAQYYQPAQVPVPAPVQQPQAYQAPPQYSQPVPVAQPRAYQQPVAPRGRGLFQSYQAEPAPQPSAYQPDPRYYQPAAQQSAANDPSAGLAPVGPGSMAHAVDPQFDRQVVEYHGAEPAGTIIIDTPHYFLYLVEDGGKALRYGIGVGRPGFTWAGDKEVSAKREWPEWRPPDDMLKRRPDLPRYMAGGPDNPLGARALYLGSTLYRIHGSNEPWTIGTQVSSGCIRMRNDDVTDLYGRVKVGTKVKVL